MRYLPNYAGALRCIGQALQSQGIEAFELITHSDEFRLQCGDPNPPYLALFKLRFLTEEIIILDRAGQSRRGQSNRDFRFDSLPELLRAVGDYVDIKQGYLRRFDNSQSPNLEDSTVEVEYETRAGEIRSENLTIGFLRESAVHMYKRRTRLSNRINLVTRQR